MGHILSEKWCLHINPLLHLFAGMFVRCWLERTEVSPVRKIANPPMKLVPWDRKFTGARYHLFFFQRYPQVWQVTGVPILGEPISTFVDANRQKRKASAERHDCSKYQTELLFLTALTEILPESVLRAEKRGPVCKFMHCLKTRTLRQSICD